MDRLGGVGQEVLQVPPPPRRVVPELAVTVCRRPIQDCLDALAHPAGSDLFVGPDRFDAAQNVLSIDLRDRQIADDRIDVLRERRVPLGAVRRVAPLGLAVGDHGLGRRAKRQTGQLLLSALASAVLNRIDAVEQLSAGRSRKLAGLGQGHDIDGTEPHVPRAATQLIAQQPTATTAVGDLQPEPVAVAVASRLVRASTLSAVNRPICNLPFLSGRVDWPTAPPTIVARIITEGYGRERMKTAD